MGRKIKRFALILVIAFATFPVCIGNVLADEIVLENGTVLTGTVTNMGAGKLTLTTDYSNPIEVPTAKIKKITVDKPVEIHLEDGQVLKGKLKTSEDGKVVVESAEKKTSTVDWTKITSFNPPPVRFHGSVAIGAGQQTGNTSTKNASVAADAGIRRERDRFGARFLGNYAEQNGQVSQRNYYGFGKYDYFFTKKFYGYVALELLNDKFQDLWLRTIVGPGVGYQVWDDPVKFLLFEGGVAYFSEDHYDGKDDNTIAARIASTFRYTFTKFLIFSERIEVYPNLEHGGEYTLRNEAGLSSPLGAHWALTLDNIFQRNTNPAPGIKENDVQWILGLQYSF